MSNHTTDLAKTLSIVIYPRSDFDIIANRCNFIQPGITKGVKRDNSQRAAKFRICIKNR